MVFHRILDFNMGWISILALFFYIRLQLLFKTLNKYKMKKVSFFGMMMISLILSQHAFSQSKTMATNTTNPVQVGSMTLNLGVGFGAGYRYGTYGTPFGFKVAAEYGMWEAGPGVITIGPELGGSFSGESRDGYSYKNSSFVVAGRAAWHYGWNVPNLDTYGGFAVGIGFNHYDYGNGTNNNPFPYFGGFVGASYYITPTFGFNSEVGYDITNFQVGVVFKLQ